MMTARAEAPVNTGTYKLVFLSRCLVHEVEEGEAVGNRMGGGEKERQKVAQICLSQRTASVVQKELEARF